MLKSLARDAIVRLTAALWLLIVAVYLLPIVPADWIRVFSDAWLDVPFLALAAFACVAGLRSLDTAAEQRFWRFWGLSFLTQLAISVPYAVLPRGRSTFGFDLYADFAFLAAFLCQMLALETRPHERHTGSLVERQRRLMSAGLVVFGFFLLGYCVLVPAEFNRPAYESAVPSFYLYIALDAAVFLRLLWMWRETWSRRWMVLYAGFATATALALVADLVELYFRRSGRHIPSSTLLDLLWTTPPALFAIGVRARHLVFRSDQRVLNESTSAPSAFRAGHVLLVCAMALPIADYLMGAGGWLDPQTIPVRHLIAVTSLVSLSGFTLIAYRILDGAREQMETTERQLLSELNARKKMDAVSRLAASVAHDFNNLIQVIEGRIDLIKQQIEWRSPLHEDLQEMHEAASRAGALAAELLTVGQRQPTHPVLVDLHDVVTRSAALLRPLLEPRTVLDLRLGAAAFMVRIDPLQFERALLNLGTNARDAMPTGGTLTLHTFNPPAAHFTGHPTLDRSKVLLRISDTGVGIEPEMVDRIFEPFFTTKGARGTGLGLAIVHGLVQQSGGSISVESKPGRGTTFTIVLPIAAERNEDVQTNASG